jgi:hypothetical protein
MLAFYNHLTPSGFCFPALRLFNHCARGPNFWQMIAFDNPLTPSAFEFVALISEAKCSVELCG